MRAERTTIQHDEQSCSERVSESNTAAVHLNKQIGNTHTHHQTDVSFQRDTRTETGSLVRTMYLNCRAGIETVKELRETEHKSPSTLEGHPEIKAKHNERIISRP